MSTSTQPSKPKRRWFQFSLKTLLIVMTVATVAFGGWIQYRRQRAQENRARVASVKEAVAAIQELGGRVMSEHKERRPPSWLEQQFDDPGDADDPVDVLSVTFVDLSQDPFGERSGITDVGLRHLKGLTGLEYLDLSSTRVTDDGLEHLEGLTNLQHLDLSLCKITGAGLEHLKGLTSLQNLVLKKLDIADAGLVHLKGLTNLQTLDLGLSNVTDNSLVHLQGLTNLRALSLSVTKVTEAGLEHLKGLTSLVELRLEWTEVTEEGIEELQRALPNCDIHD